MIARASARLGWSDATTSARIERCVRAHGLPTGCELPSDLLMHYMVHDKKRHGDTVNVVVPVAVGRAEVRRVTLDELGKIVRLGREGDER